MPGPRGQAPLCGPGAGSLPLAGQRLVSSLTLSSLPAAFSSPDKALREAHRGPRAQWRWRGSQDQRTARYLQPVNPSIDKDQLQKESAPVKAVLKNNSNMGKKESCQQVNKRKHSCPVQYDYNERPTKEKEQVITEILTSHVRMEEYK